MLPLAPQTVENEIGGLGDVSGTESDDHVARLRPLNNGSRAGLQGGDVFAGFVTELAYSLDQHLGIDSLNGLLGGGVNVEHENSVSLKKGTGELIHQRLRACVAMGLKKNVNTTRAASASSRQCRLNLGGVMTIVVDDRYPALLAFEVKSAVDAAEGGKALTYLLQIDAEFKSDGNGSGGVEDVVLARDI